MTGSEQQFYAGNFEAVGSWSGRQTTGKSPGLWSVLSVSWMSKGAGNCGRENNAVLSAGTPFGIPAGKVYAHLMWVGTQAETARAFAAVIGTIQRTTSVLPTATTPPTLMVIGTTIMASGRLAWRRLG